MARAPRWLRTGAVVVSIAIVAGSVAAGVSRSTRATIPEDARVLPDGEAYWRVRGFVRVVPPVRLPLDAARRSTTDVYVSVPAGRTIGVHASPSPNGLPLLRWPAGTIADRVERMRTKRGPMVADVRGTRFEADAEWFRAYRPVEPNPGGALFGYEWRRDDDAGHARALAMFRTAMTAGLGWSPGERGIDPTLRVQSIARHAKLLECASCHAHARSESSPDQQTPLPRRGTDASGLHVPQYALSDSAPLETYRPVDPNHGKPFVRYVCRGLDGPLAGTPGTTRVRCPDGSIPRVTFDVRAALAASDPHAIEVCASRRALAAWMDREALRVFGDALRACGISTPM